MLLLGTTDTPFDGEPDELAVGEADVEQVLAEAAVAVDPDLVARDRVRATFAGLRVLPAGDGETMSARRETTFTRGPGGMVSVAGGNATTYRRVGDEAPQRPRHAPGMGLG